MSKPPSASGALSRTVGNMDDVIRTISLQVQDDDPRMKRTRAYDIREDRLRQAREIQEQIRGRQVREGLSDAQLQRSGWFQQLKARQAQLKTQAEAAGMIYARLVREIGTVRGKALPPLDDAIAFIEARLTQGQDNSQRRQQLIELKAKIDDASRTLRSKLQIVAQRISTRQGGTDPEWVAEVQYEVKTLGQRSFACQTLLSRLPKDSEVMRVRANMRLDRLFVEEARKYLEPEVFDEIMDMSKDRLELSEARAKA